MFDCFLFKPGLEWFFFKTVDSIQNLCQSFGAWNSKINQIFKMSLVTEIKACTLQFPKTSSWGPLYLTCAHHDCCSEMLSSFRTVRFVSFNVHSEGMCQLSASQVNLPEKLTSRTSTVLISRAVYSNDLLYLYNKSFKRSPPTYFDWRNQHKTTIYFPL